MLLAVPNWERFRKAPITEAVIDIQVRFAEPLTRDQLAEFHAAIRDRYPDRQDRVKWEGSFEIGHGTLQQGVRRAAEGFMFRTGDRTRAIQVRQDGFSFNWLHPYETWEAFRNEARIHWERYCDMFRPVEITRLGLRYINRIEMPLPIKDFREYIKTAPDIADGMPQGVSALFMRLEVPDPGRELIGIITETMEAPVEDGARLPLIFDIDIVHRGAPIEPNNPDMWTFFEQMREYKNEIFFASVTDRAKAMFR